MLAYSVLYRVDSEGKTERWFGGSGEGVQEDWFGIYAGMENDNEVFTFYGNAYQSNRFHTLWTHRPGGVP